MFDGSDPEVLWLNLTNLALGIFCAVCLLVIFAGALSELPLWWRRRQIHLLRPESHRFDLDGLGATMADGGEPRTPRSDERDSTPRHES